MSIVKRAKAPTPKFFKVLRTIGLALAAVGGVILTAPIALPVVIGSVGGYLAVAGGVLSAIRQLTTIDEYAPQQFQDDDEYSCVDGYCRWHFFECCSEFRFG